MKTNSAVLAFLIILLFSTDSFAQDRKISFSAGANIPVGSFGDQYKAGPSAQIGYVFLSLPIIPIDLSVSAEYNSFSYKNDFFTNEFQTNLGAAASGFNPEWMATDFSLMVGGRLKLPGLILNPYGEVQAGVHFMNFNQRLTGQINASSSDPSNISLAGATESGNETGVGTSIGLGTEISIIPKITIDLGAKYNYSSIAFSKGYSVFRNNNSQYSTAEIKSASFITARAGIMISF